MRTALEGIHLEDTGLVRVRGADAVKFLQGQLSNDVSKLSAGQSILAGYHNPQGRTVALLRLVHWDVDDILALVPRELAGSVAARLAKYVLRAKVKVTDESAGWRVVGLIDAGPAGGADAATDLPIVVGTQAVGTQSRSDRTMFVRVGNEPPRWLAVSPASPTEALDYTPVDRATWQRLEVAAGQPQVYAATSEEFVAQMLNLDALGGIAFDKGCYTGQEVIARAHYRGRVKRRMQRFVSRGACLLSPGDAGQLADGRTFKVVLSAPLADGRCDFLAVTSLAGAAVAAAAGTAPPAAAGMALPAATSSVTTQAVRPDAPPMTDPTAPPVAGPIIDPTLAPVAAASVAPTVAAAAALASAAPTANAVPAANAARATVAPSAGGGAPAATTPTGLDVPIVDAEQVALPYALPE
jgi:folate-binding protein YgfZ